MDRRLLRSNGRIAHSSLRGTVDANAFTDGTPHLANHTTVDILDSPKGQRDRQLLLGETFVVLEYEGNNTFGFALRDGYVGWVPGLFLTKHTTRTHRVTVARSIGLDSRDVKKPGHPEILSLGSLVRVCRSEDDWSLTLTRSAHVTISKWIKSDHLMPLEQYEDDPVAVAERLIGTPYLWGGNSAFGIDCSGLVQIACNACGIPCPGDSDQQRDQLGKTLWRADPAAPSLAVQTFTRTQARLSQSAQGAVPPPAARRGDLLFWPGHVALVADTDTLIHANAHHMAVVFEPMQQALARIDQQGDGPLLRHARLPPTPSQPKGLP